VGQRPWQIKLKRAKGRWQGTRPGSRYRSPGRARAWDTQQDAGNRLCVPCRAAARVQGRGLPLTLVGGFQTSGTGAQGVPGSRVSSCRAAGAEGAGRQAGSGGAGQRCGHCRRAGGPWTASGHAAPAWGVGSCVSTLWPGWLRPPTGAKVQRLVKCPWPPASRPSLRLAPAPTAGELWAKGTSAFQYSGMNPLANTAGWPGLLTAAGHAGAMHPHGTVRGDTA